MTAPAANFGADGGLCGVLDCLNERRARGLCHKHYWHHRTKGWYQEVVDAWEEMNPYSSHSDVLVCECEVPSPTPTDMCDNKRCKKVIAERVVARRLQRFASQSAKNPVSSQSEPLSLKESPCPLKSFPSVSIPRSYPRTSPR